VSIDIMVKNDSSDILNFNGSAKASMDI
jgi:hypothetical protein